MKLIWAIILAVLICATLWNIDKNMHMLRKEVKIVFYGY